MSAFPYTPEFSMMALKHFYYDLGDKLWGAYGFVDAFNESNDWVARSHLAIGQGPIIVIIENYRSGLLWRLFMSCPEVQKGLKKLGLCEPVGALTGGGGTGEAPRGIPTSAYRTGDQ